MTPPLSFKRIINLILRDINEGNEDALRYATIDAFTLKVLWWNLMVLLVLTFGASYLEIARYIQSPFAWRVISYEEAFVALALGVGAFGVPLFLKNVFSNHYYYRILLTICLTLFSYLFVFITGGAIEAHFHFFIVIGYIAVYADWRLGWLTFLLVLVHHVILDFAAPTWVFFYGANWLSPLAHALPVLASVILTTVMSNMQRQALLAQKDLERRREEFISVASHELKTPVTSISLFIDVLQHTSSQKNDPEFESLLVSVKEQLRKITKLISDLLDASRVGISGLTYTFSTFELMELLRETVSTIQEYDKKRNLQITGPETVEVYADKDRINQVVMNLLTNALKYSRETSPVTVHVEKEEGRVVVAVTDEGIGIDAEHHAKVFDRFYRVEGIQEKTYPGMGIGLHISEEIIKKHGGTMWLQSAKGEGSTFYFSLPLKEKNRQKPL